MAGLGGSHPDFEGLLDSDQPKDTEITIVEECLADGSPVRKDLVAAGSKRSRDDTPDNHITLAAHWVVLRSLSPYFRAKLERWSKGETSSKRSCKDPQQQEQSPPYQYSLQLLVPPGQLELGRRLITAMYSSSPDLSDLEAPQLMQLVALAECYGVGKVVECAAGQLHSLKVETMPLDIAASVFELPEACLALPAVQKVQQAAADKLQQELGDLEVVWGDKDKQQQLLGLPFGALLQLLRDKRTQVASEDTAVVTALKWLAHAGKKQGQQQQQQQQLARVLRLQHCTATFLAWLAGPGTSLDQDMAWVYDSNSRLLVELLAMCGRSSLERGQWMEQAHKDRAALLLPLRPASAVTKLELSWDLPLGELQKCLAAPAWEMFFLKHKSSGRFWQGRLWWLQVQCDLVSGKMIAFVCKTGAPAFLTGDMQLWSAFEGGKPHSHMPLTERYTLAGKGVAVAQWGADRKEWPQVLSWLMLKGLVQPDRCLHIRAAITGVS